MADNNNQASQSPTDSFGIHSNEIVPRKIANHNKLVMTSVMADGQWVNINNTLEQSNRNKDLHRVHNEVTEAQQGIGDAKSAAQSAVDRADSAVNVSKVNSDAIVAQSSAISEAKAATDSAMSRAESAWNVATGAKEAVTDFDPLLKSAQSDAGKALTQIADTASALSDAKTTLGSDVTVAKGLANTAQATADNAVESAGENAKALASQAKALSDAKKAVDSDVASAKGLANAAQATADNAVKSASSVANDLATVASQAKANTDGITKVTSDVGLLQTTVADNSDNISTIQETAKQIQQSVSDNAENITTTKQTADSAVTVASDAKSNATVAVQTASEASIKANSASGQAASAVLTANGAMTTASNAKSDATVAIQTASGASLTATSANSDATIAKQNASEAIVQASNANSDFAQLSIKANKIETNVTNNSSAIASVQQTANGLTSRVGSLESKTNTQQTAIKQNKKDIALKADQTTVNTLQETVSQNTAALTTQADEISSKVTRSDVTGMLTGYATQGYTQSLVTQKAGEWNLNLTSLQTDVNAIKTTGGGVNLVKDSEQEFSGKTYGFHSYYLASLPELTPGKTYTVSFNAKLDDKAVNGNQSLFVDIFDPSWKFEMRAYAPISTDYQRVTKTFTIPENQTGVKCITVYLTGGNPDVTGTGYIKEFMLEEGTVAHTWSPAPSDMATVTSVTNLSAAVDGIKSTVATKADQSTVTQLSNLVQSKVSTSDFTSKVSQLSNDINARVTKGNLLSQINIEAGNTLIQSNKIYLDADSVVFGKDSKAFIPSAAITELNADKITAGTLKGINIYGNDIVSFNEDESEQYSFVQINEGGIYLGEAAKPDPSLIDYTERIGYTKVARIYSSKDADLTLVGNQINVKAPDYIHTSSDGTEYSTRTNLIINTVQPENRITTSAAGFFVTSKLLKSLKSNGHNDELFGKALTSRYETNESVWQSEANQIGAISGLAMDEDRLALQAPRKVTVNLSGGDSESFFNVQKNNFFTAVFGDDASHDSIQLTANGRIGFHSLGANTIYFDHGDHGATHDSLNACIVFGNFGVLQGQKNSIVKTSQGLTAIHAYETAEYYFGDIGENNTGSSSKVIVGIDQLFGQTVNTDVAYQVFLTPYSNAHVWVEKRYNNRFVVCSDQPNAQFGWELKARRKGYEHTRLTNFSQDIQ